MGHLDRQSECQERQKKLKSEYSLLVVIAV